MEEAQLPFDALRDGNGDFILDGNGDYIVPSG